MMTREGHFFHIDFGHMLGNFKKKFGIKRERAPFFFTPDLKYVMDQYQQVTGISIYDAFKQCSLLAYQTIRMRGKLFIIMFKMLVATGIEELSVDSDIKWIEQALRLDLSETDARKFF